MNSVTGTALAAHLATTRETIGDYLANGVIVKLTDGKYDQDDCRVRVLRYLRARSAGRTGTGDSSLSTERAALTREQTAAAKIKNAAARGDLASLADIQQYLIGLFAVFRERILTIPGKLSDTLSMRTREEIEPVLRAELYEALDELSELDPDAIGTESEGDSGDAPGSAESTESATEPRSH